MNFVSLFLIRKKSIHIMAILWQQLGVAPSVHFIWKLIRIQFLAGKLIFGILSQNCILLTTFWQVFAPILATFIVRRQRKKCGKFVKLSIFWPILELDFSCFYIMTLFYARRITTVLIHFYLEHYITNSAQIKQ